VLHTDYRGYAGSDDDPDVHHELWLPYAVDVVNAVEAVKRSDLPYLDGERVGLLGRSWGGQRDPQRGSSQRVLHGARNAVRLCRWT